MARGAWGATAHRVAKSWTWLKGLSMQVESPLDCKEIQSVHPKGDRSWVFIGKTDVEAESPILWPPDTKSWLIWKDPDAGKDWGQEKGTTENETVGWHHRLNGHGFDWTPGVGDGQGGLACCGSWGYKESDTTERLNWLTDWLTDICIPIAIFLIAWGLLLYILFFSCVSCLYKYL